MPGLWQAEPKHGAILCDVWCNACDGGNAVGDSRTDVAPAAASATFRI